MEARVTKVARVSARFSKSLARRRFWCEPGAGALDYPAARQDDEALRVVALFDDLHAQPQHLCHATSTCQALQPPSAQISSSQGKRRRILSRTSSRDEQLGPDRPQTPSRWNLRKML
jgi:hypothetical protein